MKKISIKDLKIGDLFYIYYDGSYNTVMLLDIDNNDYKIKIFIENKIEILNKIYYDKIYDFIEYYNFLDQKWLTEQKKFKRKLKINKIYEK